MHMHTCNVDLRGRVRQPQHRVVAVAAAKNALHVGSVSVRWALEYAAEDDIWSPWVVRLGGGSPSR